MFLLIRLLMLMCRPVKKVKKSSKSKASKSDDDKDALPATMENNASKHIMINEEDENPPISDYRVSKGSIKILKSQGIETLFPIQSRCFDFVYDGLDLIGTLVASLSVFLFVHYVCCVWCVRVRVRLSDDENFLGFLFDCHPTMRSLTPFRGLFTTLIFFVFFCVFLFFKC